MKKLSFDFIINKIWRQSISKWYKSKKFWVCMAPISVIATASITVTTYFIVDKNKEKPILTLTQVETPEDIIYKVPKPVSVSPETIYYNIDGKNFSTYKKAFEYFKTQLQKEENSYNLLRYAFEGQEYATQTKLYDILKNRFSINKINTLKNPYMNIINNANEVSRNAITIPTENFRTVYRGKDGSSYTNYEDALDTYMDFDQKYSVENITFDSKTEALWHLQHTKQELLDAQIKELEGKDSAQKNSISDKHKLDCYLQAGYCQTRDELRAWLGKNTKVGFEYKGKIFSDYNYEEFEKEFKVLDQDIIEKNIKTVDNADMNSFWISHPSNLPGFFVGPKYVETPTSENTLKGNSYNWETIDSFTPSLFLAPLSLNAFGDMTSIATETEEKFDLKKFINKQTNNEKSYIELDDAVYSNVSKSLKDFESTFPNMKGMSSFEKTLVIFKRVLNYLYTIDTTDNKDDTSPDEILKKEFKSVIKKILQSDSMKDLYNASFIDKDSKSDIYDYLSFDSIYSIFLNPEKFMEANEDKQNILALAKNIQNTINEVMEDIDKVTNFTEGAKKAFNPKSEKNKESAMSIETNKSTHYQRETMEYHKKLVKETAERITTEHSNGSKVIVERLIRREHEIELKTNNTSVETNEHSKIKVRGGFITPSPTGILSAISKAWELSNMLSFVSIQTKKMQIDDDQALYYSEPTFRVPIIGYEFPIQSPKVDVTKLVESPLTKLIGSNRGKDGEKPKVYQLSSNYYTNLEVAKRDLKMMIYKNPKKYLGARTIETNVMNKYFFYYIDSEELTEERKKISTNTIIDINASDNSDKEISENQRIEKAREKFIDAIIEKHFEPYKQKFYLDGFGETFSDPSSAKDSLLKKLQDSSKTNIKNYYSFRLDNGDEIIANTKAEMENKIRNNIIVPSKTIISSDLYRNAMYNSLQDNPDQSGYEAYELEFYGEHLYFPTYTDAWNYLVNHAKYEQHVVNVRNVTYKWKDQLFNSTDQYYDQFTKNVKVRKNRQSEVKFND